MAGCRILLVEDDWIIAKEIMLSLQDMGFEPVGTVDTGEEALLQAAELKPDLVLVDISLAGQLTGIDVGRHLHEKLGIPFIFLTAMADGPTIREARETEPYAYLVKPVSPETLYSTIEITLYNAGRRPAPQEERVAPLTQPLAYDDSIFVRTRKRHLRIRLADILWVEAYDIYAQIRTADGHHLTSQPLKVIEERFPRPDFLRVHRSYLVNTHRIEALEENDLHIAGERIPVGKTYREALMRHLSFL